MLKQMVNIWKPRSIAACMVTSNFKRGGGGGGGGGGGHDNLKGE